MIGRRNSSKRQLFEGVYHYLMSVALCTVVPLAAAVARYIRGWKGWGVLLFWSVLTAACCSAIVPPVTCCCQAADDDSGCCLPKRLQAGSLLALSAWTACKGCLFYLSVV